MNYEAARKSYENFCAAMNVSAWPATELALAEWATMRAHGSPTNTKLKPDTIQSYLAALRSVHVDRRLSTKVFEGEWLARVVSGIRRCTPLTPKKKALPITPDILEQLTAPYETSNKYEDVNLNTAWKVAFAGFLRSGEFTQDDRQHDNLHTFSNIKLTRGDVTFGPNNEYALLLLKRSKTDLQHRGVEVVLAATGSTICPVAALQRLFALFPEDSTAPLFSLQSRSFSYSRIVPILQQRLRDVGIANYDQYRGHSFRRGAA
jgi:hypothetical protein